MSKATKCQAKNPSACVDPNCPERRGHQAALNNALASQNVNAYIDAKLASTQLTDSDINSFINTKPKYPMGYKSLETLEFNGEVMDADDLAEKTGVSHFELQHEIMGRSIAETKYHPTEEIKTLRFKTALFNRKLSDAIEETSQKQFGRFTSKKVKDSYYASKAEEVQKLAKLVKEHADNSMRAEKLDPNNLSPLQSGEYYEYDSGTRLYKEGYIPEYLHKQEAIAKTENFLKSYENYKNTGEFKIDKWVGVDARG